MDMVFFSNFRIDVLASTLISKSNLKLKLLKKTYWTGGDSNLGLQKNGAKDL
jgi:hypothetical protein